MDNVHPLLVNFPLVLWGLLDDAARAAGRSRTQLVLDACWAAPWASDVALVEQERTLTDGEGTA